MSSNYTISIRLANYPGNEHLAPADPDFNFPVYTRGNTIRGEFQLNIPEGGVLEHTGVELVLTGQYHYKTTDTTRIFMNIPLELLPEGTLPFSISCPFTFYRVPFPGPSYYGDSINIEYSVQCIVSNRFAPCIAPFIVAEPAIVNRTPFVKEIGVHDLLRLTIVLHSQAIRTDGCILGSILIEFTRLRVISANVEVVRTETYDMEFVREEKQTKLSVFDILDGAPVRGTEIPIRLFLGAWKCWPAPRSHDFGLKVSYSLKFQIFDENNQKYVRVVPFTPSYEKLIA